MRLQLLFTLTDFYLLFEEIRKPSADTQILGELPDESDAMPLL
jgi:hypothetical protein